MAVSVVSFSFSRAAQPEPWSPLCWVLAFLTTSRPSPSPTLLNSTVLCSIRWPDITFKLPCGDMDTPPHLRNFFRYLAIGMCHFRYLWNGLCDRHSSGNNCQAVQRSLSSGASVYESIMGFFLPRPISSANFRPRDFLSQLPLECVTFFRCTTLNGIFGRVRGQNITICLCFTKILIKAAIIPKIPFEYLHFSLFYWFISLITHFELNSDKINLSHFCLEFTTLNYFFLLWQPDSQVKN